MDSVSGTTRATADALSVLRADKTLMASVGVDDPFACYFVSEEGEALASLACEIDPILRPFSAARYRWFGDRMESAAKQFSQVIHLGAGYDTRAIWTPAFREGTCRVFDLDMPETLAAKQAVLRNQGIQAPPWIAPVAVDLNGTDTRIALEKAGWRPNLPTFVSAEGLVYFLPAKTVLALISPLEFGLSAGSKVVLDFWADLRVERLNDRMSERRGQRLFHSFPITQQSGDLAQGLRRIGYSKIDVTSLEEVAARYSSAPYDRIDSDGWGLIEMSVDDRSLSELGLESSEPTAHRRCKPTAVFPGDTSADRDSRQRDPAS
jgi:methyltransferase (TIGR00027 family)